MPSLPISKQVARAILSLFVIACIIAPCIVGAASAETYVFDGNARSQVRIAQTTTIQISDIDPAHLPNGSKIILNATYPSSSNVNGYFISSSNVQIEASPSPSSISDIMADQYGNQYKQLTWDLDENTSASFSIVVTTRFDADVTGDLSPLSYDDRIGTDQYPEYRSPTAMVQSGASAIVSKKNLLLSGVTSQADAVDKIINFVKTSIPTNDDSVPKDALSSLGSSKGNCVNRVHLALALLRSAGIPARCVTGLVYGDKYSVSYPMDGGTATTEVAWSSGSHVWLEVYYPQEGSWVAYDPFMEKGFVDSRHVKLAVCKDRNPDDLSTYGEAGSMYVIGVNPKVSIKTAVSSSGLKDTIALHYRYTRQYPSRGTFMMAREMKISSAPTLTPTSTPKPNNTTITPTVKPNKTTVTPTPLPTAFLPVDYTKHNVTGVIVDASTGTAIQNATVLLDTIQLSATRAGKFTFLYAVSNGSYVLSVSAPGYMTEKQMLMPNNADMDVTIKMVPLAVSNTPSPTPERSPGPGVFAALAALAGGMLLRRKKSP